MTIILDCNVWITLALNKDLNFISVLEDDEIIIAGSKELKSEIIDVISRAKFSKYFSSEYIEKINVAYDSATVNYKIDVIHPVIADKKDNYLFALSVTSKADYLITGDKLVLSVKDYQGTKVITLAELRKIIV